MVAKNTTNPKERDKYEKEQNEVDRMKRRHKQLANATPWAPHNKPRIVHEARKMKATQRQKEASKNSKGSSSIV
jgi:hypothetical protein